MTSTLDVRPKRAPRLLILPIRQHPLLFQSEQLPASSRVRTTRLMHCRLPSRRAPRGNGTPSACTTVLLALDLPPGDFRRAVEVTKHNAARQLRPAQCLRKTGLQGSEFCFYSRGVQERGVVGCCADGDVVRGEEVCRECE